MVDYSPEVMSNQTCSVNNFLLEETQAYYSVMFISVSSCRVEKVRPRLWEKPQHCLAIHSKYLLILVREYYVGRLQLVSAGENPSLWNDVSPTPGEKEATSFSARLYLLLGSQSSERCKKFCMKTVAYRSSQASGGQRAVAQKLGPRMKEMMSEKRDGLEFTSGWKSVLHKPLALVSWTQSVGKELNG